MIKLKEEIVMKLDEIRAGTLGGTLCSIWASITLGDLIQTVIMAALGTLVSYTMSQLLQRKNNKG
ncbi:hypothetical protein SAMN05660841_03222 [Sphingobacterium nematocida]|uniref:Uncharacterized protein n=1 Tax=Sphingobacterium nematocida TaxID=1513896 RepID=A0A1T5FGG5_9SPHI|nr:hypothetical protein [Sphingobacterium nematocida]SKB95251.1 hypothetical protein SAMN05660841_03222 [Sphingobacterium nematocida]